MKARCLVCYAKMIVKGLPCYKGNWISNGTQCPYDKKPVEVKKVVK